MRGSTKNQRIAHELSWHANSSNKVIVSFINYWLVCWTPCSFMLHRPKIENWIMSRSDWEVCVRDLAVWSSCVYLPPRGIKSHSQGNLAKCWRGGGGCEVTCNLLSPHPGGSYYTPSRCMLQNRNRDKLRLNRPLGSVAAWPLPMIIIFSFQSRLVLCPSIKFKC